LIQIRRPHLNLETKINNLISPPKIKYMQHKKFPLKKIINATGISVMISVVILLAACSDDSPPSDGATTTGVTQSTETATQATTTTTGSKDFHHLRLDSAVLVDSFYKKIASPPFKKIIFNFKINDYTNFPASLTLIGHGAKRDDDLIDINPEELIILTNFESISTDNLLYSTMELARDSLFNIIGDPLSANPARRKRFEYLVFVPDIHTKNGQRHLYYKVQKRPVDPSAQEPTEELNPCPPFKPQ